MLGEISRRTGRPATFGLSQTKKVPGIHTDALETVEQQNGLGADLRPQTTARGIGMLFGPRAGRRSTARPAWKALRDLPLPEKLAVIRDPQRRAELVQAAEGRPTDARWTTCTCSRSATRATTSGRTTRSARRRSAGTSSPAEAFLQLVEERDGNVLVNWPFLNDDSRRGRDDAARTPTRSWGSPTPARTSG